MKTTAQDENEAVSSSISTRLVDLLGHEIQDVDEDRPDMKQLETFDLYSQMGSLADLGMIAPHSETLDISIAGREFCVRQSPGLLQSSRKEGTTGAAVWQGAVAAAEWFSRDGDNWLFANGLLGKHSTILELGSGLSGLVPCVLSPLVSKVLATDQAYVVKRLGENVAANAIATSNPRSFGATSRKRGQTHGSDNIVISAFDWEQDDARSFLTTHGLDNRGVDVVVAIDCIYNYALIEPFVHACKDICTVRADARLEMDSAKDESMRSTLCMVVQHLRQSEVFEQWLTVASPWFRTWRIPDAVLPKRLQVCNGMAVHLMTLR